MFLNRKKMIIRRSDKVHEIEIKKIKRVLDQFLKLPLYIHNDIKLLSVLSFLPSHYHISLYLNFGINKRMHANIIVFDLKVNVCQRVMSFRFTVFVVFFYIFALIHVDTRDTLSLSQTEMNAMIGF